MFKMRVIAFNGSPRKGNTEYIVKKIVEGLETETKIINIKELGLEFYEEGKENSLMNKLLEEIFEADLIVLASPTYFSNVSGLMKNFFDWFNDVWQDKRLEGKKVVTIAVGARTKSAEMCADTLNEFARICRMQVIESFVFKAEELIDAANNKEIEKKCLEIIEKVKE